MKVLHTTGGFSPMDGGLATCTYDLLSAINRLAHESVVEILTTDPTSDGGMLMGNSEPWIKTVPDDSLTPLRISRNMMSFIQRSDYDIFHTNGLWMHINHSTCSLARRMGKPYIITPHGMLYPEAIRRSYWKKWPFRKLWFDKDVLDASVVHATCEEEMLHIRNFGYQGPVAVIPNPVNIPEYTAEIFDRKFSVNFFLGCNRPRNLGFLGRLHPIKKVENLLYGAKKSGIDVKIHILGSGSSDYENFLKNETARLGLKDRVKFYGFVSGRDKFERLASLDCLFVPSDMENFGMIVPEALMVGTQVMASLGTPWESLNTNKCGWWTDNSPESIANIIRQLSELSNREIKKMGSQGRAMVLSEFEASAIAAKMMELYNWILKGGRKPDFVYESWPESRQIPSNNTRE